MRLLSVPSFGVVVGIFAVLAVATQDVPHEVNIEHGEPEFMAECDECCPITKVTYRETHFSTITETKTTVMTKLEKATKLLTTTTSFAATTTKLKTATANFTATTTKLEPTTKLLTTTATPTATKTVSTSYPVYITNTLSCTPESIRGSKSEATVTVTKSETTTSTRSFIVTAPLRTITVEPHASGQPTKTIIVTLPGETKTVGPGTPTTKTPFRVSVCRVPTGGSAPLDPKSNLTFGCKPGFVCDPPMPDGCNVWPGPPSDDFICCPEDCIPAPSFNTRIWKEGETSYYPPSYGYFNLNPEAFGLSYDIFKYDVVNDGNNYYSSAGNWASQATLSNWPRSQPTSSTHSPGQKRSNEARAIAKRSVTPAVCYDDCENAYIVVSSSGKADEICKTGSAFKRGYDTCAACISHNEDLSKHTILDYVEPQFAQFINFCSGEPSTATSEVPADPDPVVSSLEPIETSGQVGTSSTDFTPIEPSTFPSTSISEPEHTSVLPLTTSREVITSNEPTAEITGPEPTTTPSVETTPPAEASTHASLHQIISDSGGAVPSSPVATTIEMDPDGTSSTLDHSSVGTSTSEDAGEASGRPAQTSSGAGETSGAQLPSGAVSGGKTRPGGTEVTTGGLFGTSRANPPTVVSSAPAAGGYRVLTVGVAFAVAVMVL